MIILACTAAAAAVIAISILILYRRQVKTTCRQLSFLLHHKTNMRLLSGLPFSELNTLADNINELLDTSQKIQQEYCSREMRLKETITSLSHDIRTPLTSMDGYFQLLVQSDSPEERAHHIAVIQSRIASLKDMLEELFTYTKLQDEEFVLDLETTDFSKCAYETVFSFYDEFKRRGIEPETDFYDGHLPIEGNREALCRIIQNIIKNALLHGNSQISLSLFCDGRSAGFRCSNDVKNPDDIDMSRIFSRFYKADAARTKSSTGLGLSISKALAERMGGTLSATLHENIFTVTALFALKENEVNR